MTNNTITVGIDVSQEWLDVHVHKLDHSRRIANNAQGMSQLMRWLQSYGDIDKVVCEATGGLERLLLKSMQEAGIACVAVSPNRIAAFRGAVGKLAKTDLLDAQLIAEFAAKMDVSNRIILSEAEQHLKDFAARRRQLVEMQTAERNRLKRINDEYGKKSIQRVLKLLEKERKLLEERMLELVKSDADMQNKMQILASIPGIGNIVALTLISEMPELGKLGDKQISALAGLAPQDKQSGVKSGKATIRGGRKCVRAALYMAAMSAKKHNPNIKIFYERLTINGKPKMLALTAAMRKLLLLANSLLKQNKLWTPTQLPA